MNDLDDLLKMEISNAKLEMLALTRKKRFPISRKRIRKMKRQWWLKQIAKKLENYKNSLAPYCLVMPEK